MAYSHPQQGHPEETQELRVKAGQWLQDLRKDAGLTQNDIAKALGFPYYTMVSQIERGLARVPPDKLQDYATVLKMDPQEFVKRLYRFYDPFAWQILWGGRNPLS